MKEKHRQLLIEDISMRGMALYTMACRHLPAFIDKSGAHQSVETISVCLCIFSSQVFMVTVGRCATMTTGPS